jgi:hypothetical protein
MTMKALLSWQCVDPTAAAQWHGRQQTPRLLVDAWNQCNVHHSPWDWKILENQASTTWTISTGSVPATASFNTPPAVRSLPKRRHFLPGLQHTSKALHCQCRRAKCTHKMSKGAVNNSSFISEAVPEAGLAQQQRQQAKQRLQQAQAEG